MFEIIVVGFIIVICLFFLCLVVRGGAYQKGYQDAVDDYYVLKSDAEKMEHILRSRGKGDGNE